MTSPSSDDTLIRDDPSIDRLDHATRQLLGAYWLHRAHSELRVSYAFQALRTDLETTGASDVVLAMIRSSIEDERRHSELCRLLATRYAGTELHLGPVAAPTLPAFEGDPALRTALRITGMCCINETLATVWLKACFDRSTSPLARAANRVHLREEITHARLGWAHLASPFVTPSMKSAISVRLPRLLRANVPRWFVDEPVNLPACGFPDHGVLAAAETKQIVLTALVEVVFPGFVEVGLDDTEARDWAAA